MITTKRRLTRHVSPWKLLHFVFGFFLYFSGLNFTKRRRGLTKRNIYRNTQSAKIILKNLMNKMKQK